MPQAKTKYPSDPKDQRKLVPQSAMAGEAYRSFPFKALLMGKPKSGKTLTALKMAAYCAGLDPETLTREQVTEYHRRGELPIVVIETLNERVDLYAPYLPFSVVHLDEYHPRYIWQALEMYAQKDYIKAVVIDSWSAFWEGAGGVLDMVDSVGGGFSAWAGAGKTENIMLRAIEETPLDVILTVRTKDTISINQDDGKTEVSKVQDKPVQRGRVTFELDHLFILDNDNTGVYHGRNLDYPNGSEIAVSDKRQLRRFMESTFKNLNRPFTPQK